MNNINTLNNPSISGIQTLNLDQLTVSTIDSDLIYIDRIEAKEMIIDTKLTLTNTGVISVGASTISDVELTYLDGTTSNIQTQLNNINTSSSGLTATVATHTTPGGDAILCRLAFGRYLKLTVFRRRFFPPPLVVTSVKSLLPLPLHPPPTPPQFVQSG